MEDFPFRFNIKVSCTTAFLIAGSALCAHGLQDVATNASNNEHGSAGAAYFMTNQPEGNFIISCNVGRNGRLTFCNALPTGGNGAHVISLPAAPVAPDALFSQGSVTLSGQQVYAVNAGSNTVSVFSIDKDDPANLKMVGHPTDTGGEFPISVAVSKQSGHVCVLNGGKINGVNCFKQDNMRQGLVKIPNTNRKVNFKQTTPATGPPGSFSQIMFSEDGNKLIVLFAGIPETSPGMIMTWDVDSQTGELSEEFTPVSGGIVPFSMTFIPGTNAILTTDPGVGFNVWDFTNNSFKNASVKNFPIEGQNATCWSSVSPKTGNFYLGDVFVGAITEVHVDKSLKGSVVNQYPQGHENALDNFIATIEKKEYLYSLAPGVTSVIVLSIDAPGKTTRVQSFSIADATRASGVKIDGNNLAGMAVFVKGN